MTIPHFILTRFNVRMGTDYDKNKQKTLSRPWHEQRFSLFEQICLPSILGQEKDDFFWLLFFDEQTPRDYIDRIRTYERTEPNITPIFCKNIADMNKRTRAFIDSEIAKQIDVQMLITTRLDNDDALRQDFTLTMSHYARQLKRQTLIDCVEGYQLILAKNKTARARKIIDDFNPFLTLIEPPRNYVSIGLCQHREWRHKPVDVIRHQGNAMWIQTIHDKNVLNTAGNTAAMPASENSLKDFNLALDGYSFSKNLFVALLEILRLWGKKFIRKVRK